MLGGLFDELTAQVEQGVTDFATQQCEQHVAQLAKEQALKYLPLAAIAAVVLFFLLKGK